MANGITVQAGYTWSKTMTETEYLNAFDVELHRVIGAFDRTHMFVTSGIVELPFGRDRHWGRDWNTLVDTVFGGWQVSYLLKQQSGAPLGFGNYLLKPGMTEDDIPLPGGDRDIARWFNVDAFERAPAQQLVSNVRTTPLRLANVRGPGYVVLDLGIMKDIVFGQRDPAAAPTRVLQHPQHDQPEQSGYVADQHGIRHDHVPESVSEAVPIGRAFHLLKRVRGPGRGVQTSRRRAKKKSPTHRDDASGFVNIPGSDLLSHRPAPAVPSAVEGLTSVFGMGTGVTPPLWPPGNLLAAGTGNPGAEPWTA